MKNILNIVLTFTFSITLINCTNTNNSDKTAKTDISVSDNSQTSLDWNGTYVGTLPCADCEGIKTVIQIKSDLTYNMQTQYLGKGDAIFETSGKISWDDSGSKITLEEANHQFLVGENVLFMLDTDGKRIEGELADFYQLKKEINLLSDKKWKLVELNGQPITADSKLSKVPFIQFDLSENRVNGHAGCNSFGGTFTLSEGNRIAFSQMFSTEMACPDMTTEDQFLEMINKIDNFNLSATELVLNKAKMAPLARFEAVYFE